MRIYLRPFILNKTGAVISAYLGIYKLGTGISKYSLYYNSCGDSKYGGAASCPNNKSPNPCTEGIHEICNDDNSTFWCGTPNSCDTCRRNKAFKCRSYRGKWYPLFGNCYRSGTHVATTANCQANDGNYHSYTCK